MKNFTLLSVLVQILCFVSPANAVDRNSTGQYRLFNDLIFTNLANERPRYNPNEFIRVEMDFTMRSVSHFDETTQQLYCTGYFDFEWTDDFLTWTPRDYDGVGNIKPPSAYVWKPEIIASNSFQQMDHIGGGFVSLSLSSDGRVKWSPGDIFYLPCDVDIQRYPFDSLVCYLELTIWNYSEEEVIIVPSRSSANTDNVKVTGQWSLDSAPTIAKNTLEADNLTYSRVEISLNLSRTPTNFIFSFILPVLILSLLGTFVFLIPNDSGEKISFAITIPLSYGVYLSFLTELVPQTSNGVSVFVIFLGLTLIAAAVFVILGIVTVRISKKTTPVTNGYRKFTKCMEELRCIGCGPGRVGTEVSDQSGGLKLDSEPMTWERVASALDRLFFIIFSAPILLAILILVIFVLIDV